jgi:serine/threonine protein kinase/tetratricopeptide (TPR) repeat protein
LIAWLLALPAAERMFALERACAEDKTLNERLPEIMAAIAAATDIPQEPRRDGLSPDTAVEALRTALDVPSAEAAATRIGPYKLLQEIGRGGFGVVWMAEQEGPIRRRVALKIIKAGMDTKEVIARFEAERQALALMDHPNIARVFDAGATDSGRPFFVMELVRGVAITRYCDENRLSVDARLRLFMMVCRAVQHAHQKGVIHRDLKPSNILVTLHDGVPVPKVIDFGIAKATMSQLTEKTLFTQFHAFIGTPAYTSPEQMEMSGLDIDTRSDIYSLGVLLYELLAGRPPFDSGELVKAGLEAMRRTIREVDPPRPSHRVTTLAMEERVTIAQQRSTEAAKLSTLMHGDLDWIVMRCLEKDRTRRYETSNGLALDIQRHLENEPVSARPPGKAYVLRKLVRRNKLIFVAGGIVVVALVLGLVVSAWEAVRATRAERLASLERAHAEDLLTFMLGDLRTQLAKVGRIDVLESVGDRAMAYFASRDAHDLSDTELKRFSKALSQIGEIRMEEMRYAEAATAFSEAYDRAAALAARHPGDGDILFERGQAEFWNGVVHMERGELAAGADWWSRYHDTCAALVALDPSRLDWQLEFVDGLHNIAVVGERRGELAAARSGFLAGLATLEKMIASDPGNLDLRYREADAHSCLGTIAEREGEFAEALKHCSTQATELEYIAQADPKSVGVQPLQANALLFGVTLDIITGQYEHANELLVQAQKLLDALVAHDPANVDWKSISLNGRLAEATLVNQRGDVAGANRIIDKTLSELEVLSASEPTSRYLAIELLRAWRLKARLQYLAGRTDAAASVAQAVGIVEKLSRADGAVDNEVGECAKAYVVFGEIAAKSGDAGEARRDWMRADELLAPRIRDSRDWRLLDPAARAAAWLGRSHEARATIDKLNSFGYVPLDPWPDQDRPAAAKYPEPQPK